MILPSLPGDGFTFARVGTACGRALAHTTSALRLPRAEAGQLVRGQRGANDLLQDDRAPRRRGEIFGRADFVAVAVAVRAAPLVVARVLADHGLLPVVTDDVASLEVVRAVGLHLAGLLERAAVAHRASADDRRGLAEQQILG